MPRGKPNRSGIDWSDPAAVAAYKRQNERHREYNRTYYQAHKAEINRRIVERRRLRRALSGKPRRVAQPTRMRLGTRRGENHPRTHLMPADIRDIRQRKAAGYSYENIAREYGLQRAAIYKIVKRLTWKHVSEEL